jgi:hypothetical protein
MKQIPKAGLAPDETMAGSGWHGLFDACNTWFEPILAGYGMGGAADGTFTGMH